MRTMLSLPIDTLKSDFLNHLSTHNMIVEAETGSGKSTRLPVWAQTRGKVLVVEPRRIACTSLAQYVADQKNESVGQSVGYSIKLENCSTDDSQIIFVTPGLHYVGSLKISSLILISLLWMNFMNVVGIQIYLLHY